MHKVPTPRLGGLAIVFSFVVSLFLFYDISNATLGMIIGALMLVFVGIIDDVRPVRALYRFIIQLAAAGIVVSQGVVIEHINIFGEYYKFGHFAIPITILWIAGLTNALNLIDGLDGLSCGISTISAVSLLVVTILMGEFKIALMLAILVGACLGFLPFNKTPVIFIGFGAEFLGFVLAVVSIQGVFKVHAVATFVIPFLILGVPIFDTVFAGLRRILSGRPPFSADRGHLHHRLVDMGFTKKQSVRILYAVSALLGVSSVMLITQKVVYAVIIIAISLTLSAAMWIIFRDDKMKYESGLMPEPEEPEKEDNVDLIEEKSLDFITPGDETDEAEFKQAKAEKAER
jgi:UDP-GlcNAc:undecaprenyl-phosphate GlcNAc-1-phosphate transferase